MLVSQSSGVQSKIKVLMDLVSAEGSLSGLQTAVFSLHVHMVERKCASSLVSLLLIRALIPSQEPHPMTF
jgi:hypothetical protein